MEDPLYIRIKNVFSWIDVREIPREMHKTEGEARGFQHLNDQMKFNALKSNIWSLLLHNYLLQ